MLGFSLQNFDKYFLDIFMIMILYKRDEKHPPNIKLWFDDSKRQKYFKTNKNASSQSEISNANK